MAGGRADPMDFDLSDFAVTPAARPEKQDVAAVRETSEAQNFLSRAPKHTASQAVPIDTGAVPDGQHVASRAAHTPSPVVSKFVEEQDAGGREPDSPFPAVKQQRRRRKRSQRTHQINIRVTEEVYDRFQKFVSDRGWVSGEALEKALPVLEEKYPLSG